MEELSEIQKSSSPVLTGLPANAGTMQIFLVHYGEIALKGRNRKYFESMLSEHIRRVVKSLGHCRVRPRPGRIEIEFADGVCVQALSEKLQKVFGIVHFSPCFRLEASIDDLKASLEKELAGKTFGSFAVRARRAEKHFPVGGQWVNEEIGRFVKERTGWRVDLDNPEVTIRITLFTQHIYYSFQKIAGAGGLPTGMGGRVGCLLSGGIDSPVAAYRIMRRGAQPTFIHFHSAPHTTPESQEKVWQLAEKLSQYVLGAELIMVPFGDIQQKIIATTPEPYRVLLYRRMMIRIANALAAQKGLRGLVTGESLGQVASQTLSNLAVLDAVSDIPILRPLIGMDKEEIIAEARRIGTYETSIQPHEDCCAFMLPKNPRTQSRAGELEKVEKVLDIADLVAQGLRQSLSF